MGKPSGGKEVSRSSCGLSRERIAICITIADGDVERNEVVADDEQNQQDDAVPDKHVEEWKSKT